MQLGPVVLQIVGGIALPLVLKMTMALLIPHGIPVIIESLLGIVLIRLPLSTLLPEATTAIRAFITIAET